MARKRGGLAGLYDRNKGIIKTLAPVALGAIPGIGVPLAVAAGAALGADTEGRKFFDKRNIGGAIRGGIEGYSGGKMGQSVRNMLTAKMAERAGAKGLEAGTRALEGLNIPDMGMPDVNLQRGVFEGLTGEGGSAVSRLSAANAPTSYVQSFGAGMPASEVNAMRESARRGASRVAAPAARPAVGAAAPAQYNSFPDLNTVNRTVSVPQRVNPADAIKTTPGKFGRFTDELRKNKDLIGQGAKGLMNALPSQRDQADMMQAETDRMRFEEAQRQAQMEEQRRRAIMQLLAPYVRQNVPSLNLTALGQ